jgi:predicted anti-sigma-YlaC factor YlaD
MRRHCLALLGIILLLTSGNGCSLKKKAVNTLADVLGEAESVYLSDEDPELVAAALPFNLKTLETLLQSNPTHRGLLLTTTKSFVFYTYGFVEPEADLMEDTDFYGARETRRRASRLYRRAFNYGLRGIEVRHPGFSKALIVDPEQQAARLDEKDVPLTVWTAAALGAAIGTAVEDAEATADIAVVGVLLNRALELDEPFEDGAIHEFLISYEAQSVTGSVEQARKHYERALALSRGRRTGIWLTWAESISVQEQNREEFEQLLGKVLAFEVDSAEEHRLLNILAQRRARWLQEHIDELFL